MVVIGDRARYAVTQGLLPPGSTLGRPLPNPEFHKSPPGAGPLSLSQPQWFPWDRGWRNTLSKQTETDHGPRSFRSISGGGRLPARENPAALPPCPDGNSIYLETG